MLNKTYVNKMKYLYGVADMVNKGIMLNLALTHLTTLNIMEYTAVLNTQNKIKAGRSL